MGELSGGPLTDTYKILQFHFHWGSTSDTGTEATPGSEHTYDGKQYLMEMHIVHVNNKFKENHEYLNHDDGLAVTGFMFKKGVDIRL